jgi:hypothetical protein
VLGSPLLPPTPNSRVQSPPGVWPLPTLMRIVPRNCPVVGVEGRSPNSSNASRRSWPPWHWPTRRAVAIFDEDGNFITQLITGGRLAAPWGMTLAPAGFGSCRQYMTNDSLVTLLWGGPNDIDEPDDAGELRVKAQIRDTFGKYVDPRIVAGLLDRPELTDAKGSRREMTILFCDMKGFTAFSDGMTPAGLVNVLNRYMTVMSEPVRRACLSGGARSTRRPRRISC